MPYFTKEVDKYLAAWILPDTWNSAHPLDLGRLYHFAKAIHYYEVKCSVKDIKERILRAIERNHSGYNKSKAQEDATYYAEKISVILVFFWTSKEKYVPDPEIESWEPPLK